MKVAMLTTVGDRCGIAAYTRDLMKALQSRVDLTVVPIEPGRQLQSAYEAQAILLNQADVVHIQHEHSFWGGILPNSSAFWNLRYLIRKPVVITAHTTTSLADLLRLKSERRLPHRIAKELLVRKTAYRDSVEIAPFVTGRCIVHTEEGRNALVARGANPQYVHVIPAGIPPAIPARTRGEAFRQQHVPVQKQIISIFGYVAPNKGYEVALDALRDLPEDVVLVIAGGVRSDDMETYARKLQEGIAASGLGDRVIMTGFLSDDDIAEVMAATDVVLAPHTYATGSYSITIPLAYGKAIVASDQACFSEIASADPCLETVPTGDSRALSTTVAAILEDRTRRTHLEERARAYAEVRTWDAVAQRTVEVYQEAILDEDRLAHHRTPTARR